MEIPLGKKDLYCNFTSFHFIIKISLHFDKPSVHFSVKITVEKYKLRNIEKCIFWC